MAGRAARGRRAAGDARRRARPRPRRGRLHGRPPAARDAARGRPALAARPCARHPDRPRARARAPGVHAAIGPGDCDALADECGYEGAPSPPSAPTPSSRRSAAVGAIEIEWEVLEPLLDADEAVARGELIGEPRARRPRRRRARPRRGGRRRRGEFRTQIVLHNSLETHQSVVQWVGDTLEVYTSTQYIWGVRDEVADGSGCRPTRSASSATSWAAASARRTTPATTRSSRPSSRGAPAGPCAAR